MNKYEKYKDSGIAWIGTIPEHWKLCKTLFALSMPITDGPHETPDFYEKGIIFISAESIKNGNINFALKRGYISKEYYDLCCKKYTPKIGDIYMIKSGATTGNIAIVNTSEIFQIWSPLAVFRVNRNFASKFMYYYLQSSCYQKQVQLNWSYGTQQNIGMRVLEKLTTVFPPFAEQQAIAEFLDGKCLEIDELVSLQEQMIKELQAYKQSVITETVTKGLDPNAPLKDSSIEWIGEIPKHWDEMKISQIFSKIGSGTTPKSMNENYYCEDGINWLQTGDLTDSYIYTTNKKITQEAYDSHSLKLRPVDSIVMAMYGATIGKLGLLTIETTTNQACCVMGGGIRCYPKYGFYNLMASRTHILTLAYGGGQPNISQDVIRNIRLAIPPLAEQQAIANHLDKKCNEIDQLISIKKQKITELKEYKKSVIFEYVTGKKKVN